MAMNAYQPGSGDNVIFDWPDYFPQYDTKNAEVVAASGEAAKAKVGGVVSFMNWLEKNFPEQYKAVLTSRPDLVLPEFALAGLAGLSADEPAPTDTTAPATTDWGKTLTDILSPLVGVWQQQQLIKLNIKRAEQGLAPVDSSAVSAQVQVGVSSEVKKMGAIAIAAIVGAIFLVSRKRK